MISKEIGRATDRDAPAVRSGETAEYDHAVPDREPSNARIVFRPEMVEPYARGGYELIRLNAPDAKDERGRPLGKAPVEWGWRVTAPLGTADARARMANGCNVGVRLRDCDLIVDVDPRNFEPGDDPLARLGKHLGIDWSEYPTVITGSGGRHIYMLKPETVLVVDTLETFKGVEFKADGRQVVAAGSAHQDTGQPYIWDPDPLAVPLHDVRQAPVGLIELVRRPDRASSSAVGTRSAEEVGRMLAGLDVLAYADHDRWLKLMMASHHASGGDARQEFIDWSTQDPAYVDDAGAIGRRWDSLHSDNDGRRITERHLFKELIHAGRYDLVPPGDAAADFDDDLPEILGDDRDDVECLVDKMNKEFCAVLESGRFTIFMDDTDDIFDPPRSVWTRMSREAFRHYYENSQIVLPKGRRQSVADVWLNHPRRRSYPGIVMDPENRQPAKLNLWRGWSVKPEIGNWSLLERLI